MGIPRIFHRSAIAFDRTDGTSRLSVRPWLSMATALLFIALALTGGVLLTGFIEQTTLLRDAKTYTQLLNSIVQVEQATGFFLHGHERDSDGNGDGDVEEFVYHLGELPHVLRANVYGIDGTIIWSTDQELIGRHPDHNPELQRAFQCETVVAAGTVGDADHKPEHAQLGHPGERFVESYLPIRGIAPDDPKVVGVVELYRIPERLFANIHESAYRAWLAIAALALLTYGAQLALIWRAERVVRRQQAALVAAEKLATAGEMASAVAHGLRNPLASIRSSAELGLETDPPEETRGLLAAIVGDADRLEGWIRQYLASTRADDAADAPSDPCQVIQASLSHCRPLFARTGVDLDTEVPERLPPVKLHPVLLEQLLNGLLANAGEASAPGASVMVRAAQVDRSHLLIEVQDQGPGMSEAEVSKAFEPFMTTKRSGLGLGLPITLETLERHGGRLRFTSRPGLGTTVGLELPLVGGAAA